MRAAIVIACLALAACGGSERRGPPGGAPRPSMAEAGGGAACLLGPYAGADGALSRAELDAAVDAQFASADANQDGALDKAEIQALNTARRSSCDRTPVIDWSGTGRLERATFGARYATEFERADADGDGLLTAPELDAALHPRPRPERRDQRRQQRPQS